MTKRCLSVCLRLFLLLSLLALTACKTKESSEGNRTTPTLQSTETQTEIKTITLANPTLDCSLCTAKMELIYGEAFRRLGYTFELIPYPPERALVEANAGRVDGDGARIRFNPDLQAQYPNLIQVEEIIDESVIAAYATNPAIQVDGWGSLAGTGFMVGYMRGYKIMEINLLQYVPEENRVAATDLRMALRMLATGRTDIIIGLEQEMQGVLQDDEFKDTGIVSVGDVDHVPFYPYLHKKHMELASQLAAVLREMKADGTYDRLMEQAEQQIRKNQE